MTGEVDGFKNGAVHVPNGRSHVWSYVFVQDRTEHGRPIRMLTAIDEFTRRHLAFVVSRRLRSDNVLRCLINLFVAHGPPEHIGSDNVSDLPPDITQT